MNGDGKDDPRHRGHPMLDPGGNSYAGESYVVFGKSNGTAVELFYNCFWRRRLRNQWYRTLMTVRGQSVSSAGDVNGGWKRRPHYWGTLC